MFTYNTTVIFTGLVLYNRSIFALNEINALNCTKQRTGLSRPEIAPKISSRSLVITLH